MNQNHGYSAYSIMNYYMYEKYWHYGYGIILLFKCSLSNECIFHFSRVFFNLHKMLFLLDFMSYCLLAYEHNV
jgi:hypothetical protein